MPFLKIILKNKLAYRWGSIINILSSVLMVGLNIFLWAFLYSENQEMIRYMTGYAIFSNIISMFYLQNVSRNISTKVLSGTFSVDLLRPINFFYMTWQMEFSNMLANLLMQGVPVILLFSPILLQSVTFQNVLPALFVILLGHFLNFLIFSFIGFLSFLFLEISAYTRLIEDTIRLLSGSFIPLAILPRGIQTVCRLLPFHFLYSLPLELLLNQTVTNLNEEFLMLGIWILIFGFLNAVVYRYALKKVVVHGG